MHYLIDQYIQIKYWYFKIVKQLNYKLMKYGQFTMSKTK